MCLRERNASSAGVCKDFDFFFLIHSLPSGIPATCMLGFLSVFCTVCPFFLLSTLQCYFFYSHAFEVTSLTPATFYLMLDTSNEFLLSDMAALECPRASFEIDFSSLLKFLTFSFILFVYYFFEIFIVFIFKVLL